MRILLKCTFIFLACKINSQSAILSTGGTFVTNNSLSFSVGQILIEPISSNTSNTVYFGVQQPKELMSLSFDEIIFTKNIIYPNPTNGNLNIKLNNLTNFPYQVQLFDITGKIIISKTLYQPLSELDLTYLSNGIYMINITKNSKSLYHLKIIKK